MKTTKLYDFFVNVIPLAIATAITGMEIDNKISEMGDASSADVAAYLIAFVIVITLSCYAVMHILAALPRVFYCFRRISTHLAAAEGYWIEHHVGGERVSSIAQIQYNEADNDYIYSGYSYTEKGEQRGQWYANKIIDESNRRKVRFSFMGQGVVRGSNPLGTDTHRTTVNLVGNVDFLNVKHTMLSKVTMCVGCYYDFDSRESENQNTFYAERITKKMWLKYIGKPKPANDLDIKEFVIKCTKDYDKRKNELDKSASAPFVIVPVDCKSKRHGSCCRKTVNAKMRSK